MRQRILFYQQFSLPYFGILSIVSYLKAHGYDADVVVASLEHDPIAAIREFRPDVIGISVMSVEHRWLARTVKALRAALPQSLIVVGGIHAILYPEEVLSLPEVDLACTSDGEEVMLQVVVRKLADTDPQWSSVKGIGYRRRDKKIHLNERAPLFNYRSEIIEDRSLYYRRYPLLSRDTAKRFISSRGCPYKCNFCYNEKLRDIFKDNGQYFRRKEADNLVEEIKRVSDSYKTDAVFFVDDLFTMDKDWLKRFLLQYKKEIGIPFVCTTRANILDEERAAMLADAGCRTVSFGIESGNYEIRKIVLNKDITDESIINCGRMLRKYGIRVQTANMFCLPGETLHDAFETIELNIKAGTNYAFSSLLMPFPKTAIAEYCIKHGYVKPDYSFSDLPESFMTKSILKIDAKEQIINVQRLSYLFIRYPLLYKMFYWVVRLKMLSKVFALLFILSNFLRHKEERGVSFLSALQYAWRMRKTF